MIALKLAACLRLRREETAAWEDLRREVGGRSVVEDVVAAAFETDQTVVAIPEGTAAESELSAAGFEVAWSERARCVWCGAEHQAPHWEARLHRGAGAETLPALFGECAPCHLRRAVVQCG